MINNNKISIFKKVTWFIKFGLVSWSNKNCVCYILDISIDCIQMYTNNWFQLSKPLDVLNHYFKFIIFEIFEKMEKKLKCIMCIIFIQI